VLSATFSDATEEKFPNVVWVRLAGTMASATKS
jgi:hypothetical protein